jgi:hypothetical protein
MIDPTHLSDAELEAIASDDRASFTRAAAERIGVRPELALAVRHQESRGNPKAISPKGARGEFQLMPGTADDLGVNPDDPYDNIVGGLTYLKRQIDDFGDERLGLAAYNAGPAAVRKHGGVPPFAETQDYVSSILGDPKGDTLSDQPEPDISALPDEELERISKGETAEPEAPPTEKPALDVPHIAPPESAMKQGKGFVYADDANPLNPKQAATYEAMVKAGKIDPEKVRAGSVRPGSEALPLAQRDPQDAPKPGDWYVTVDGALKQAAEDPWLNTAGAFASDVGGVHLPGLDPRYDAMKRAAESGVLLGGRNELTAAIQALPQLFSDKGQTFEDRFSDILHNEDRQSAQARRDFPIAYDASAATGAIATGALAPEGLLPRLGISGAAGALSTDGGIGRRAVGAGLGMAGGEVLNFALPRAAGAVLDMTGLPMRAAGGAKSDVRAAGALERAMGRDALPVSVADAARDAGVMPLHVGGDNLTGLAEVLAQSPGKGQAILRSAVRDQQAGVPARVKAEIGKTFGGDGSYFEKLGAAREARKTEADKAMTALAPHEVTLDENSVSALRSDLARSAIKEQVVNSLASPDPAVREAGARLNRLHDDLLDKPGSQTITVRDAQNISKSLLDAANAAYTKGDGARGAALKELGKAVRENASTPERGGFSEYGDFLRKYGDDSQGIEALQAGRAVFSGKMDVSAEALRKTFAGWPDAAKENYRQGIGEALLDAVRRKGGVTEARQLLKNEEFADRIRIAVPDNMSFTDFMASLEREVQMADRNNRIVGGSPTYARQAARDDLTAQARDPLDVAAEVIDTGLSPARLAGKTLKAAIKALPRKDQSVLGDPAANAALAKALTDPDEMTRLLNMLEHYKAARTLPTRQLPARSGGYLGAVVSEPEARR